jgi:hypothetical protein
MRVIIPGCPQITDLYLYLGMTTEDQVHDLAVSLKVICPTRVIMHDPFHTDCGFPEPLGRLYKAVHNSIHSWRSLVSNLLLFMQQRANSLIEGVPCAMLMHRTASARSRPVYG